jgi:hypothetical protein
LNTQLTPFAASSPSIHPNCFGEPMTLHLPQRAITYS